MRPALWVLAQSQVGDAVPSGTSLVTTNAGTMGPHPSAGRRSHRRLSLSLLALAVGATLCVAASPALANSEATKQLAKPKMTLDLGSTSSRPNRVVRVTGDVWPVELVGEWVQIAVQRKSKGKWTPLWTNYGSKQVLFTPPASWEGTFNMEVTRDDGNWSDWTSTWRGQVRYELRAAPSSPTFHFTDYTMTWAQGEFTNNGIDTLMNGHAVSYAYTGFPFAMGSPTPFTDWGMLRWYFAEDKLAWDRDDKGIVPKDSYEGNAWHNVRGTLFITGRYHPGETEEVTGVSNHIDAEMWPGSSHEIWRSAASFVSVPAEAARPVLDEDGNMVHSVVRPMAHMAGYTEKLNWVLTPSTPDDANILGRSGFYSWEYTPTKKGLYRLQATIFKDITPQHPLGTVSVQSAWRTLTVK
jgi:hypothetical protein